VTARSHERGGHAERPRGYVLPFPDHQGLGTPAPARPGTDPTEHDQPPGGLPRGGARRHRRPDKPVNWLWGKRKVIGVLAFAVALIGAGFTGGFGNETSAEPTVQAFLLDWQQGSYAQAAALTQGGHGRAATELAAAYADLDATNAFFAMGAVRQHGNTAVAQYTATVDLAQPGLQWVYRGKFGLTETAGHWSVDWSPSVINPSLAAGDRLAVLTAFPARAPVETASGQSLLFPSADYRLGVYPGRLAHPARTAAAFSQLTGLNQQQLLGQILAAPPRAFLSLLRLEPRAFRALWPKASRIAGIRYQRRTERLFGSRVPEAVGAIGTEDADQLRAEGAAYQPGTTVGLSGLEQAYQDELAGTPTTSVVVVNPAGRTVTTLWNSPGRPGTPVRTTLTSQDQAAAQAALASRRGSGEIVALNAQTGAIRALASRESGNLDLPSGGALDSKVVPGMAFSIVSAAALLSAGVSVHQPLPCEPVAGGAGVTFAYQPSTSATATFASDFAAGCGTALATMSRTLSPGQLQAAEHAFGVGGVWHLRVPAFSGSASAVSGPDDLAAEATGQSGVLMSPLSMAMVAAEVASGAGRAPFLVPTDAPVTWPGPLSPAGLSDLRQLMRLAVAKGSAHAANLSGTPVYGQAGVVQTGRNAYLSWFVGYRGNLAVAAVETSTTASQAAAAALAGAFLKTAT
jgi:hypothetical protein